ncbi:MAG: NUDIX domain-containing protein [Gammaproteobacteria bacterium]|nr:MAG: NUDIX domain-containing protein [Gammaproteobacteria bacterium]
MQWKIKQRKRNYDGHFKVDQLVVEHELFAGGFSKALTREQVSRQNAVAVLPYDPIRDEVVLVEQFRVGAVGDENPWLMEIIAGLVEEGEDYEEVAHREALEEANCKLEDLQHVASFFPTPGGFSELSHVYIGKTDSAGLEGLCGLEEEGEDIRVHVVPSATAIEMLHQGKLRSAIPMIAMYNFIQLKDELQKKWSN